MTPTEFAIRAIGIPWRKWRSDWDAMDCFGLIVLYFREVLGIDLGCVPQTSIADGFDRAAGWIECGPESGATCWMAWRDDAPTHCGVLLNERTVIHSEGSDERPGNVRVTRLEVVRRFYGEIKFYRYEPC